MANPRQEIIDAFEEKAIGLIMAEGFDRAEAQAIFNDWLARAYKRQMVQEINKPRSTYRGACRNNGAPGNYAD